MSLPARLAARPAAAQPDPALPLERQAAARSSGSRHSSRVRATLVEAKHLLPVAVLAAAYAAWFGALSVAVYDGYSSPGYDMGIFDQGMWLLSHFKNPFVTVMGRNLFGDHTSFILGLAVPLYWIWPAPQALLVLQSCLLAAAAIPIYLLARRSLRSDLLASVLAACYLLNPALQNGNLEQFHPEAFLVLSVTLAVYAAVVWRPGLLAVAVAASLLVKEDSALLMIPLGVWVALRRNRWAGVCISAASAAYMAVAFEVVIATILGTPSFYTNRLPFGGLWGLLGTAFSRPLALVRFLGSGRRLWYLWQLGFSVGWGFVIAPELAVVGLLTFAENEVSTFGYMHQILYHYSLALAPVLVLATVHAISTLRSARIRLAVTSGVAACALSACVLWGLAPFSLHSYPHLNPSGREVAALNRIEKAIPSSAVVSAYYPFVAHLDHRTRIYQWPTPFAAKYWGLYNQEGERLPFAGQVQYLMLPLHMSGEDEAVFESIESHFRLVTEGGGAGVWKRLAATP